jgi:uncharacterized protein (TIGR03437 family)
MRSFRARLALPLLVFAALSFRALGQTTQFPNLSITKSHFPPFYQGLQNGTYVITVSNGGPAPTSGTVTVTEMLPQGLTATSMTGNGWNCTQPSGPCTQNTTLQAGRSYEPINLLVNVAPNAPASVQNMAKVTGGGDANPHIGMDLTAIQPSPNLSVSMSHSPPFYQGLMGGKYSITVSNGGPGPTTSAVTVMDTLPAGLTATSIQGQGWNCTSPSGPCTRSDTLNAGLTYPPVTLTVNVDPAAPASVTNLAMVSGGGDANTPTAMDSTAIQPSPNLSLSMSHSPPFSQGLMGGQYMMTVSNGGPGPTTAAVTVMDTLPANLTATSMQGQGWNCTQPSGPCTRSDALNAGLTYPAIVLTVNVAANAPNQVTNTASLSGGGDAKTHTAMDMTSINPATCSFSLTPANNTAPATAGMGQFAVAPNNSTCAWTSTATANWLTGVTQNGMGAGNISFSYAANMSSQPRTGTIRVAGSGSSAGASSTFALTQVGAACDATFAPTSPVVAGSDATSGKFSIMFQANDCPWEAISTATWLNITSGQSGSGSGSIEYKATANMSTTPRVGAILASFTPFVVLQQGAAPTPGCTAMFTPAPPVMAQAAATTGSIGVNFPTGAQNCAYSATASDTWITITSGVTGSGKGTVGYSLSANSLTSSRSGSIVISGQPYAVIQAGGSPSPQCMVTFKPASPLSVPSTGGSGSIGVSFPTSSSCGWSASSNASWLTLTSGLSGTGNGTIGYMVAANVTGNARSGAITVTGQSFTISQAASASATTCTSGSSCPTVMSAVSASDYGQLPHASPGSIVEVYGTNLANKSRMWTSQDFTGPNGANAPTVLDGVAVTFNDQPGYLSYISGLQVNAQIPTGIQPGTAQVTVTNNGQTSAPFTLTIDPVDPGLLAPQSFLVGGNAYVVAFLPDGTYVLPSGGIAGLNSRQAHPGEAITMYGIGMGPALDSFGQTIGGGQMASGLSSIASPVAVQFGDTPAVVAYAGLAPGYVGLYQLNVMVPQVPDSDLVPLTFTLNGVSTQSLFTAVHH